MTIIKPPYEQVLVGMGWIVGGPRETKEDKRKKRKGPGDACPWAREKQEKHPGDECLLGLVVVSVVVVSLSPLPSLSPLLSSPLSCRRPSRRSPLSSSPLLSSFPSLVAIPPLFVVMSCRRPLAIRRLLVPFVVVPLPLSSPRCRQHRSFVVVVIVVPSPRRCHGPVVVSIVSSSS